MKDYKVVISTTLQELESRVLNSLEDGWHCQGGISIVRNGMGDNMHYQAMVK